MGILRALFKGVSAVLLILMLALSLAPMTSNEVRVLGEDASRMTVMQRRIAIGVLEADKYGLLDALTNSDRPNDAFVVRWNLQMIVDGTRPMVTAESTAVGSTTAPGTGARFVTVD